MAQTSIDEVLARGRKREAKTQLVLGSILLGGGLAWWLAMDHYGLYPWLGKAALAFGVPVLFDALFRARR